MNPSRNDGSAAPAGAASSPRWTGAFSPLLLVLAGCSTLPTRHLPDAPDWTETRAGPFRLESSRPLSSDDPAVESLGHLESRLTETLELEPNPELRPIRVLVLDDRVQLARVMHAAHPELPDRRAFFVAEGERRTIYTCQGERLGEDLRHEATHALLHASVGSLPLWLDEGLAEYFEIQPDGRDEEVRRARALLADREAGWSPDLPRLESMTGVEQLTAEDYREAWGWAHLMVQGPAELCGALDDALRDARDGVPSAPTLSARMQQAGIAPEAAFWRHIRDVSSDGGQLVSRGQSPARRAKTRPAPTFLPPPPPVEPAPPATILERLGDGLGRGLRTLFNPFGR